MACVLARPPLYGNPCTGHTASDGQVQNISWEDYNLNWISGMPYITGTDVRSDIQLQCTESPWSKRSTIHVKCKAVNDNRYAPKERKDSVKTDRKELTGAHLTSKRTKRKVDECDFDEIFIPPKRISPFLNTPKERKEERRKIIKISLEKIKDIEDAELSLRRSVLINNTVKKMKNELRKETKVLYHSPKKKKQRLGYGLLNNDCVSESYLIDDPFLSGVHEKITDDMTDILMNNLENKIGARIGCLSSVKDKFSCNIPAQTSCPANEGGLKECEAMDCTTSSNMVVPAANQLGANSCDLRTSLENSVLISTLPKPCPGSAYDSDAKLFADTDIHDKGGDVVVKNDIPLGEDGAFCKTIEDNHVRCERSERTKPIDRKAAEKT